MNREIIFRAKKVDGGEWVEGYVVQSYGFQAGSYIQL